MTAAHLRGGWQFREANRLVVDFDTHAVIAQVHGTTADGVLLASAHRLQKALDVLTSAAGAIVQEVRDRNVVTPAQVRDLEAALIVAAGASYLATEPTEH